MRIEITLRSGAQLLADVDEFTLGVNRLSGELRELSWVHSADGQRRLKYVDHNAIVAVVAVHDPSEQDAAAAGVPAGEQAKEAMPKGEADA